MQAAQQIIETAFENRTQYSPTNAPAEVREAIDFVLSQLDSGALRVAERIDGEWVTHQWIKKAVLLSFRLKDNEVVKAGDLGFYDKVQTKFAHLSAEEMAAKREARGDRAGKGKRGMRGGHGMRGGGMMTAPIVPTACATAHGCIVGTTHPYMSSAGSEPTVAQLTKKQIDIVPIMMVTNASR